MLGIHKANCRSKGERVAILLIAFASLAQSIVEIGSLGFFTSDWRAHLVFSEFVDRLTGEYKGD